jgi:hypothetical protein
VNKPPSSYTRQHDGADIYAVVGAGWDDQALSSLEEPEMAGSADLMRAVGSILGEMPRTIIFENVDFVQRMLRRAEELGDDVAQSVASGFYSAVLSGGRSGAPGQPFPEDVEQRDRSREIASGLSRGSIEEKFYSALRESAEQRIRWDESEDVRFRDGRNW